MKFHTHWHNDLNFVKEHMEAQGYTTWFDNERLLVAHKNMAIAEFSSKVTPLSKPQQERPLCVLLEFALACKTAEEEYESRKRVPEDLLKALSENLPDGWERTPTSDPRAFEYRHKNGAAADLYVGFSASALINDLHAASGKAASVSALLVRLRDQVARAVVVMDNPNAYGVTAKELKPGETIVIAKSLGTYGMDF